MKRGAGQQTCLRGRTFKRWSKEKNKGMIFVVVVQSKIGLGEKEVTKLDQIILHIILKRNQLQKGNVNLIKAMKEIKKEEWRK